MENLTVEQWAFENAKFDDSAPSDFGDQLARGVYLYQVRVRSTEGNQLSGASEFEKLVILK